MVKSKTFFSTNHITIKIDDKIDVLNENLRQFKNHDTLSSRTVKTALEPIHENLVVVLIDKTTNILALIYKRFYDSIITKEIGLGNNVKTNICKVTNDLS